jgi:hypothetical protein
MANSKNSTQFISNEIVAGLAQMESHLKAEDGEIESCSAELWDSWPVRQALREFPNDPESVLAVLAGRMFLAGSESTQSTALPSRSVSAAAPVLESNLSVPAVVDDLAQAIYAVSRGEAGAVTRVGDHFEQISRAREMSSEAVSVLKQLVLSVLALERERIAAELGQNEVPAEQIPQDEIDRGVEDIFRQSYGEGGEERAA